jgi:hypothetical protein
MKSISADLDLELGDFSRWNLNHPLEE